ncbi:hypothetical protein DFS34DRAFT_653990 [Phlyctochytrium arcticum]|nr:hypothetical protein DFS34DRAFT_653990 [Phlyctochytrium arcticum]
MPARKRRREDPSTPTPIPHPPVTPPPTIPRGQRAGPFPTLAHKTPLTSYLSSSSLKTLCPATPEPEACITVRRGRGRPRRVVGESSATPAKPIKAAAPQPPPCAASLSDQRLQSQIRLKSAWDQICAKYARAFPDDDEIDIQTQQIVVDKGRIRAARARPFGDAHFGPGGPEAGELETSAKRIIKAKEEKKEEKELMKGVRRSTRVLKPAQLSVNTPTPEIIDLTSDEITKLYNPITSLLPAPKPLARHILIQIDDVEPVRRNCIAPSPHRSSLVIVVEDEEFSEEQMGSARWKRRKLREDNRLKKEEADAIKQVSPIFAHPPKMEEVDEDMKNLTRPLPISRRMFVQIDDVEPIRREPVIQPRHNRSALVIVVDDEDLSEEQLGPARWKRWKLKPEDNPRKVEMGSSPQNSLMPIKHLKDEVQGDINTSIPLLPTPKPTARNILIHIDEVKPFRREPVAPSLKRSALIRVIDD